MGGLYWSDKWHNVRRIDPESETMYRSGLFEFEAAIAVARSGGFRAAAAELGVSATSVSNAIAGLEARLGARLFNRTTRSVALSAAGEQFVSAVGPALRDIVAAVEAATSHSGLPAGRLRLNCSVGAARQILVPVVLEFQRQYPQVEVEVVTDPHLVDIVAKGFDAGIRTRDAVPGDMVAVPFGRELRFVVVGSPAYLLGHAAPTSPGDLMMHRCVQARWPNGAINRWQFVNGAKALAVEVPGSLTLDEPSLMRDAVLADGGLAYLWEEHVSADIASGRLVSVLSDWMPTSPGFCLYHPDRRNMTAALRAFIDLLRTPALPANSGRRRAGPR
jgi:DNA-binding transcriptional LysR family regulator